VRFSSAFLPATRSESQGEIAETELRMQITLEYREREGIFPISS